MSAGSFEQQWRRRFERFAVSHCEDHFISGWSAQGLGARLETFAALYPEVMPRAGRVLDLGCGPGTYGRWLARLGVAVFGMDYSMPTLRRAQGKDDGLARNAYTQGDAYQLPYRSEVFDGVICIGVLQTLSDEEAALREMTRVLKEGGLLLVDGLNAARVTALWGRVKGMRDPAHHRLVRYAPRRLGATLRILGYTQLRTVPVHVLPPTLHRLRGALRRLGPLSLPLAHSFFMVGRRGAAGPARFAVGDARGVEIPSR